VVILNEDDILVDKIKDKKTPSKIYGLNHNKDVDVRLLESKNKWTSSINVLN
jgi:hypothetical protein